MGRDEKGCKMVVAAHHHLLHRDTTKGGGGEQLKVGVEVKTIACLANAYNKFCTTSKKITVKMTSDDVCDSILDVDHVQTSGRYR